jgi:hypothetical protein
MIDLDKLARGPTVAIIEEARANSPSLTASNRNEKRLRTNKISRQHQTVYDP